MPLKKKKRMSWEMVDSAMTVPDQVEEMEDGTKHYVNRQLLKLKNIDAFSLLLHKTK